MSNTSSKPNGEDKPQKETFFEFPCRFPIKIMANPNKEVIDFVLDTLEKYVADPDNIEFNTRESKTGKYISITAIFEATSKDQLDDIYRALTAHKDIHMVL
ncbi:MAG: YbeD family protein [Francisellaceae bacterium]